MTQAYDKNGSWITCGEEQGNTRFEDCIVEIGKIAGTNSTTEVK